MNIKIIFGITTTIIILFSSISTIAVKDKQDLNDILSKNISNIIKDKIYQNIDITPKKTWYPGFFITLLLAPFIILYLIIAIILDIANP